MLLIWNKSQFWHHRLAKNDSCARRCGRELNRTRASRHSFFLFTLVGIPHMTLAAIASLAFIIHIPPRGDWRTMNRKSRRCIFKDRPGAPRAAFDSLADEREGVRRWGRKIFALPRERVNRQIHCDATGGAERGRGCIQMRVRARPVRNADCRAYLWLLRGATRYADSPLFPDRVLKARAGHYAVVELVYGVP